MKQILTLVLVLATLGLGAQKVDTTKLILNGGYGYDYKIWKVDSSLILPGGNKDTSAKAPRQIKIIDTTIWYTGKDGIWRSIHPKGATVGGGASGITKLGLSPYALVKLNDSTYYADSTVLLPRMDSIPGGYYPWSNPLGFITSANFPAFKQNGVVSGGAVVWLHDYVYNVSASTYYIDGVFYTSPSTDITLAASTSLDRIDAFALTTSSTAIALTGTAAITPTEPTVDANTQLRISIALVSANTTQPVSLTNNFIYKENLGQPAEWTTFSSGSSIIVLASTNNPYAGTKDIEGINVPNGVYALFTAPAGVTPGLYNALTFQIRSKATFGTTKKIVWRFYNASNLPIGNPIPVGSGSYGFNSANSTAYQTVTIPISDFGNISGATALRATQTNSSGTIGWYMDNIQLQNAPAAGTNSGSVTTVTGTYPIVITSNPTTTPNVTVDTGRGPGQISTGGDLIKVRDSLSALITTGGNGTVTSVAKGFGIRQDGTITVAGTINADSTVLSTVNNVNSVANTINTRITNDSTFLKNLIDSKTPGTGTVTSVATNTGTGITGGTITTTGTLALDTAGVLSTKANVTNISNTLQGNITIVNNRLTNDSTILKNLIDSKGSGTVTSVAKGWGIVQDGTITTTGMITADSAVVSTKAYRQKGIDSLAALIAAKQNSNFGTQGSIIFRGAVGLSEKNDKLFYDSTNVRVGIGTNTPSDVLTVRTPLRGRGVTLEGTDAPSFSIISSGVVEAQMAAVNTAEDYFEGSHVNDMVLRAGFGRVLIGNHPAVTTSPNNIATLIVDTSTIILSNSKNNVAEDSVLSTDVNGKVKLKKITSGTTQTTAAQTITATVQGQTLFPFTSIPSTSTNSIVFVNGVRWDYTTGYTYSGNNLTTTTGLDIGDKITLVQIK